MTRRMLASLTALLALAGCELFEGMPPSPPPPVPPAQSVPAVPEPSLESKALAAYYGRVQSDLLSQGLLRRDGGGASAPFGAHALAQDFIRIALYEEYTATSGGQLIPRAHPSTLRRWDQPIRMEVVFGATVPPEQRRRDLAEIRGYTARLSSLTGVPISFGAPHPNFHVLVLDEDERRAYGPRLRAMEPGLSATAVQSITEMPRSTFCLVHAFSGSGSSSAFSAAIAVIRAEHPQLLRLSCIHEELAQGMGLANDSPSARPSIFNDDEEFALLTPHDEMLLRMLYDPRLHLGMREAQAAPVAEEIATEYFAGNG